MAKLHHCTDWLWRHSTLGVPDRVGNSTDVARNEPFAYRHLLLLPPDDFKQNLPLDWSPWLDRSIVCRCREHRGLLRCGERPRGSSRLIGGWLSGSVQVVVVGPELGHADQGGLDVATPPVRWLSVLLATCPAHVMLSSCSRHVSSFSGQDRRQSREELAQGPACRQPGAGRPQRGPWA